MLCLPDYMSVSPVSACLSNLPSWRFNKPLRWHIQVHTGVLLPKTCFFPISGNGNFLRAAQAKTFLVLSSLSLFSHARVPCVPVSSAFPAWPLADSLGRLHGFFPGSSHHHEVSGCHGGILTGQPASFILNLADKGCS